jgi:ribonuclease HI
MASKQSSLSESPAPAAKPSLRVHTDGACPGNPGKMGLGVCVFEGGKIIAELSRCAGTGTNNVAEYLAAIDALEWLEKNGRTGAQVCSDSRLLVFQLRGVYEVKSPNLIPLHRHAKALAKSVRATFEWVPREKNTDADRLASSASGRS